MGWIIVDGIYFVDGVPVARTPPGNDSDKPVETSHLPSLLGAGSFDVEHLSIDEVGSGPSVVGERFGAFAVRPGETVVACDAATSAHLETVAAAAVTLDERVAYVGSAGLAGHVRLDSTQSSGVLGIVGSVSPVTFEQLSELDPEVLVEIDGREAIAHPDEVVERVSTRGASVLADRSSVVLTAARSAEAVDATIDAGRRRGLTPSRTRELVATLLGECATSVYRKRRPGGVFVTGGVVATTVLDALGATGVRLTGHAFCDASPLGRIEGGLAGGVPLVTKAGGFGESDAIVKALDLLSQYDDGR